MSTLSAEEAAYFESGGTDLRAFGGSEPALPKSRDEKEAEEARQSDPAPPVAGEAEKAAPEPPQAAQDDDEDEGVDPDHKVPYQQFKRERQKLTRKLEEKDAELAELREFRARMDERLAFLAEREQQRQAPAAEEKVPTFEEDFVGATEHVAKRVESLEQQLERERQEREEIGRREAFRERVREDEERVKKELPDFDQALAYLRDSRVQELAALGCVPAAFKKPGMTDQQAEASWAAFVRQDISQQAWGITSAAARSGRSPARAAYEAARARGYSPKQAEAVARELEDSPAEKKDEARAASVSLSRTGGSPTGPMTAERLNKMSMKDFAAYVDRHPEVVDRLLRGG